MTPMGDITEISVQKCNNETTIQIGLVIMGNMGDIAEISDNTSTIVSY